MNKVELLGKYNRNRKRSKRRAIYCPIHKCYLDSVSPKYSLFSNRTQQFQQRKVSQQNTCTLVADNTDTHVKGEWLEAFWCDQCQETRWYHVQRCEDRVYEVSVASSKLWQHVVGIYPVENLSVSEFTRRQARMGGYKGSKGF